MTSSIIVVAGPVVAAVAAAIAFNQWRLARSVAAPPLAIVWDTSNTGTNDPPRVRLQVKNTSSTLPAHSVSARVRLEARSRSTEDWHQFFSFPIILPSSGRSLGLPLGDSGLPLTLAAAVETFMSAEVVVVCRRPARWRRSTSRQHTNFVELLLQIADGQDFGDG